MTPAQIEMRATAETIDWARDALGLNYYRRHHVRWAPGASEVAGEWPGSPDVEAVDPPGPHILQQSPERWSGHRPARMAAVVIVPGAEDPSLAMPICDGSCVLFSPCAAARRRLDTRSGVTGRVRPSAPGWNTHIKAA